MLNCAKCGQEIEDHESYAVNGEKLCEECAIAKESRQNPSKPCGNGSGQ
ncbi:hypothetical protein [Candidatus Formimonas warabiya]|nr:hypothetical protein [Candidatus Formimonas warabiya]